MPKHGQERDLFSVVDSWSGSLDQSASASPGSRSRSFDHLPASTASLPGLPEDIKIYHLPARESALWNGPAWPELHGGIAIVWRTCLPSPSPKRTAEEADYDAILYTPHGTAPSSLPHWLLQARRRVLVHCLDRQVMPYLLGGPVALGMEPNGLALCARDSFAPHYYCATHDEHKQAFGLVARVLRRYECAEERARILLSEQCEREEGDVDDDTQQKEDGHRPVKTQLCVLPVGKVLLVA